MSNKNETAEQANEMEIDAICRKVAQQIHESLPQELQVEVRETPIAMCAKRLFTSTGDFIKGLVKEALERVSNDLAPVMLAKYGCLKTETGPFTIKDLGGQEIAYRAESVKHYAELLVSENPLAVRKGPLTLHEAVLGDIYFAIEDFIRARVVKSIEGGEK